MKARDVIASALDKRGGNISWGGDELASDVLSALSAAGYKVVPVEATDSIIEAGAEYHSAVWDPSNELREIYRAMVEASE